MRLISFYRVHLIGPGRDQTVDPDVVWAKLAAMAEGAIEGAFADLLDGRDAGERQEKAEMAAISGTCCLPIARQFLQEASKRPFTASGTTPLTRRTSDL
jgi:hypothetical protein